MDRLAAAALVLAAAACAPFSDPTLSICGNHIVEAEEDCDDPEDALCGGAGEANECRRLCKETSDPDDRCEAGSVCGGDGVCRRPSGDFGEPQSFAAAGARWFADGDLDGDGRDELILQLYEPNGVPSVEALFFDPPGLLQRVAIGQLVTNGAVGDLDGDARDELVLAAEPEAHVDDSSVYGHGIWSFDADRSPRPRSLPTLRTTGASGRVLHGDQADATAYELVGEELRLWDLDGTTEVLDIVMPGPPEALGQAVATTVLPGESGGFGFCRLVALAYQDEHEVVLLSLCGSFVELLDPVAVPPGAALDASGTFFVDVDGHGGLDLVTSVDDTTALVAYGDGLGGFGSTFNTVDGAFAVLRELDQEPGPGPLLAVGDVDDDGSVELVVDGWVYTGDPDCFVCSTDIEGSPAVLVDLDRDGDLDIVTGGDESLVKVYLGDPLSEERFIEVEVPLKGAPRELVVGDFDIDTTDDVAFVVDLADRVDPITKTPMAVVGLLRRTAAGGWEVEERGPFVGVQSLAAAARNLLVARVVDEQSRPAGAFVASDLVFHVFEAVPRRPVLGHFADAGALAISASATEPGMLSGDRLAWLPLEPGGAASPYDATLGDRLDQGESAGYGALEAPIDLDGDGIDELLVLGTDASGGGHAWIAALRAEPEGRYWRMVADQALPLPFVRRPTTPPSELDAPVPTGGAQLQIADLDGDGDEDALAIAGGVQPQLVALLSDGGALGPPVLLDLRVGGSPLRPAHLQPWHRDDDGRTRWVVAGAEGFAIATVDLEKPEVRLGELDKSLAIETIGVADLDGDGLLDLAIGGAQQVQLRLATDLRGPR